MLNLTRGGCVESGCQQEGVVGLQGAWLCLDHFAARLQAMKMALRSLAGKTE